MKKKNYEELELKDDFMFGKVMSNKELCRATLETLLGIPIDTIEYPEKQKAIQVTSGGKSVRLDVYVQDNKGTVYDAEMQQGRSTGGCSPELPQRSRYYQGMIDLNLLEKGVSYRELKECYIIFICTFDPFGQGLHRYTFRSTCQENKNILLEDKSVKVFFNTKGIRDDVPDEVGKLLKYLDSKECSSELTMRLDAEVERSRHNEIWRREYMKTLLHDMEVRQEGHEEGLAKGLAEGLAEGQARVNLLNAKLGALGRTEDIIKAAADQAYQEQLFAEFGI